MRVDSFVKLEETYRIGDGIGAEDLDPAFDALMEELLDREQRSGGLISDSTLSSDFGARTLTVEVLVRAEDPHKATAIAAAHIGGALAAVAAQFVAPTPAETHAHQLVA